MNYIFTGFIFLFLNFNLTINDSTVGLLPDFVGAILIFYGLNQLKDESAEFKKMTPVAIVLTVYYIIDYICNIVGYSTDNMIIILLEIAFTIIYLWMTYCIILGIVDMEHKYNTDFNGEILLSRFKTLAILEVCVYITTIIPIIFLVVLIVLLVVVVMFLIELNKSRNAYNYTKGLM